MKAMTRNTSEIIPKNTNKKGSLFTYSYSNTEQLFAIIFIAFKLFVLLLTFPNDMP